MKDHDNYRTARRHVGRKIGFSIHLSVFVLVNAALILFNLLHNPRFLWSLWPLFGWGIGLSFHGLAVFLNGHGSTWKERMINREIARLEGKH
ncbi:2TM domain-containing protein [Noviherbaspirillum massiliense]|uniref:2TM domain-containing protein n=1 Tax=Noviherbaspirillum massiliense TaxID=1465823 RepID=UPI0002ECC79E|nr:2TM domain-containing protein [Noviherbaspirillum massiliense]